MATAAAWFSIFLEWWPSEKKEPAAKEKKSVCVGRLIQTITIGVVFIGLKGGGNSDRDCAGVA